MSIFDYLTPQSQLNYTKFINNSNIQISFRYYSPSKLLKQSINTNQRKYSRASSNQHSNNIIHPEYQQQSNQQQIYPKSQFQLEQFSPQFYINSIHDIQHSPINYYQQFQQKLFNKIKHSKKQNDKKIIKIKLTKNKQQITNQLTNINKNNQFIKNVQINLNSSSHSIHNRNLYQQNNIYLNNTLNLSNQSNALKQKPIKNNIYINKKPQSPKKNEYKIKIKLYENNKNPLNSHLKQNNFKTPRKSPNSLKKGIRVYSSDKKNKNLSKQFNKYQPNKQNIIISPIHLNKKIIPLSNKQIKTNQKIQIHLLSNKKLSKTTSRHKKYYQNKQHTQRNRIKTQYKNKNRVYSKDKIKKTINPIIKSKTNRNQTSLKK